MSDYESPYPNPKHRNPEKNEPKAPESVHHEAKYMEEKLRTMEEMFLNHGISRATEKDRKDFIRTLLNEAPKPKVGRIELSNLASDILDSFTTSRVVGLIEVFLKSKDIEVED